MSDSVTNVVPAYYVEQLDIVLRNLEVANDYFKTNFQAVIGRYIFGNFEFVNVGTATIEGDEYPYALVIQYYSNEVDCDDCNDGDICDVHLIEKELDITPVDVYL